MNSRLFGLLTFCLCLISEFSRADERVIDPAVLDRLRTQAVKDWQAEEREYRSLDVSYKSSYRAGPKNDIKTFPTKTYRLAYDADRQVTLWRMQNPAFSSDNMTHSVANSRYDFRVSTPVMTEQGTLDHLNLVVSNQSGPEREGGVPTWNSHRCHLMAACRISCMPLQDLLNSQEFEPIQAVEFVDNGSPRIRFSARYLGEQGFVRRKGGTYTVILDPSHRHRLLSWVIEVPHSRYETFDISYHVSNDVHTPREIVYKADLVGEITESTWTFDLPKPCTIPDAEFYLPHYGFSEQMLETLNPNPWPRWLLIAGGVVTIAIGARLLLRLSRQRT